MKDTISIMAAIILSAFSVLLSLLKPDLIYVSYQTLYKKFDFKVLVTYMFAC